MGHHGGPFQVLWVVPSPPVPVQKRALQQHFGDDCRVVRLHPMSPPLSPSQVAERFVRDGFDVMVFSGPLDQFSWYIRETKIRPVRPEILEVGAGAEADIFLSDGRRLQFVGFVQVEQCHLDIASRLSVDRRVKTVLNLTGRRLSEQEGRQIRAVCATDARLVDPPVGTRVKTAEQVLRLKREASADRVLMPGHLWGVLQGLGAKRETVLLGNWGQGGVFRLEECRGVVLETTPL